MTASPQATRGTDRDNSLYTHARTLCVRDLPACVCFVGLVVLALVLEIKNLVVLDRLDSVRTRMSKLLADKQHIALQLARESRLTHVSCGAHSYAQACRLEIVGALVGRTTKRIQECMINIAMNVLTNCARVKR